MTTPLDASFGTIIEAVADAVPDRVAVSAPHRDYTYAEFDERAARLATAMLDAGVTAGDKVACYLYNSPAYLETVYAAFKIGAVPVNANYRYTGAELASLLRDADAAVLVYSASLAANVEGIADQVPTMRLVVPVAHETTPQDRDGDLEGIIVGHDPHPREQRTGADLLFMYTGGTTGKPKGVIWRHRDLLCSLAAPVYGAVRRGLPDSLDDVVHAASTAATDDALPVTMPVVPLMHATGLFNTIGALLLGGTVVLPEPAGLQPANVWRTVAAKGVKTIIIAGNAVAAPLLAELAAAEARGEHYDLTGLRTVLSSGTAFSDQFKRDLHERSAATIIDAIGSSEGGPFVFGVTRGVDDLPTRFLPVPATRVFSDDDREVAPGSNRVGVLAYSGPAPVGYYKDDTKTDATFRVIDGIRYAIPGDHVSVNADGSIRFLGRKSGVINSGGEKVHPQEVEDVLLSHPAVTDCVVVGAPDPTWGERVAAIVAVAESAAVSEEELQRHTREHLAGYKVPRSIVLLDRLPRTPAGKIEMSWARKQVADKGPY